MRIEFFEKPGCAGNARQQAALRAAGHELVIRSLPAEPWTAQGLRPFFSDLPVAAWFNPSAPAVKSGAIRPETLDEAAAMALLLAEPLLIRRPLLRAGGETCVGFAAADLKARLGLDLAAPPEGCAHPATPCP